MHVYLLEDDTFWIHSLKVSCLGNLLLGKSPILNGLSLLQSHPSVDEACTIVDCDHLLEQPGKKEAGDTRSTAKVEGAGPRPVDLLQSPLNQPQQRQSIALCLYVEVQMYIKQDHEAIYIAHFPGLMPQLSYCKLGYENLYGTRLSYQATYSNANVPKADICLIFRV